MRATKFLLATVIHIGFRYKKPTIPNSSLALFLFRRPSSTLIELATIELFSMPYRYKRQDTSLSTSPHSFNLDLVHCKSHKQGSQASSELLELPPLSAFAHEPRPLACIPPSLFRSNTNPRSISFAPTLPRRPAQSSPPNRISSLHPTAGAHFPLQASSPYPGSTPYPIVELGSHETLFEHTRDRGHESQAKQLGTSVMNVSKGSLYSLFTSNHPAPLCFSGSTPIHTPLSQPSQSNFVHRNHLSISSHMGLFTFGPSLSGGSTSSQGLLPNSQAPLPLPNMDQLCSNAPALLSGNQDVTQHQHTLHQTPHAVVESVLLDSRGKSPGAFNIDSFLLTLLRKLDASLPLDDFYNILYNPKSYNAASLTSSNEKIDKTTPSGDLTSSIDILQDVLETFRVPETLYSRLSTVEATDLKPSSINLHEVLRSFLALKILHHSLIEDGPADAHSEHSPIPRLDIYKVYYILCQKLILKYPTSSNTTSLQQKLIFGQSKLGKLIKLVYPNLVSKRLGSRGMSRYNYLGVRWNTDVVNDEIKSLCKDSLVDLNELFKLLKKSNDPSRSRKSSRRQSVLSHPPPKRRHTNESLLEVILSIKAHGTFVEPTHFLPAGSFTLKAFLDEELSNDVERNWFAASIKTSSDALLEAKVLPDAIDTLLFGESRPSEEEDDSLLRGIIDDIIPQLLESPKQSNIYLHLFMVISLKAFPHLLLLRKLPHTDSIQRLGGKVQHLIQNMEAAMEPLVGDRLDLQVIKNFLGILSRMMHLNKLLAAFFKADLQEFILKEMQDDIVRVVTEGLKEGMNETYRLISEALSSVLLAYRYKPQFRGTLVDINIKDFLFDSCHVIEQMVSQDLAVFVTNIMEGWVPHTEENSKSALKFRLLLATLKLADEGILNENIKARFPSFIIRGLYSKIAMEMLQFTYRSHASMLGSNPANPTFRLWYVLESFIQEYLDVLAELNSLHLVAVEQ